MKIFALGILAILITFPEIDLSFTKGIDSPLKWVFNYLFENGLNPGQNIIFPYGPLAFFTFPLKENIFITLVVRTFLQLFFIYNLFNLINQGLRNNWLLSTILSIFFLKILNFNLLVLSNIALCYLLYYSNKNLFLKYSGFILTAFALYIKVYTTIISGIITFSFLFIITFYHHKKILHLVKDVFIITGFIILFWLIMYGNFSGIIRYFTGMIMLALDNSTAVSYYPQNNWIALIPFLIIIFSIPFLQKSGRGYYFGLLFILSIFAAWKHGMAREDINHMYPLLLYIIIYAILFIVFIRKNVVPNIILVSIAVLLFYVNLKNVMNYAPIKKELSGINNLTSLFKDLSSVYEKVHHTTIKNIESNTLSADILERIRPEKADVYPWDYSIIVANDLNWQPRPVIQSFISYTSWLDRQNANHFRSEDSPTYLIWDFNKVTRDFNGGKLESIDNRNLLNDEPKSLIQLLTHYQLLQKDNDFLIFQRRTKPLEFEVEKSRAIHVKWNEWIKVPVPYSDLVRAKVFIDNTFMRKLKSFFYKDEQFYIYYRLTDGTVHKYRIVPKNATDGIWINPYLYNPLNSFIEPQVNEILFKSSNVNIMKEYIELVFEDYKFGTENHKYPYSFFGKDSVVTDNILYKSTFDFESNYLTRVKTDSVNLTNDSYDGRNAYILNPGSFSPAFKLNLDTIPVMNILISTNCWVRSNSEAGVILVIQISSQEGNNIWKAININHQVIDFDSWNNISNLLEYSNTHKDTQLSVYLWNEGDKEILFDDFTVKIVEQLAIPGF